MMMTAIDIRYLAALLAHADTRTLAIVKRCPECGDHMPTDYTELCHWSEIHTVIDIRREGEITALPTLVIGCEGYHIIEMSTGREKDHDADL